LALCFVKNIKKRRKEGKETEKTEAACIHMIILREDGER